MRKLIQFLQDLEANIRLQEPEKSLDILPIKREPAPAIPPLFPLKKGKNTEAINRHRSYHFCIDFKRNSMYYYLVFSVSYTRLSN